MLQVPTSPSRLQLSQAPVQALLQQTASTQLPLSHSAPAAHEAPSILRQAPAPLHAVAEHSVSGSTPVGIGAQAPSLPPVLSATQAWHSPVHAVSQQTPSTHLRLVHSSLALQLRPLALVAHRPVPVQVCPPGHSFAGSVPAVMGPHMPSVPPVSVAAQASHRSPHASTQQTPSVQLLLRHCSPEVQAVPGGCRGTHAPRLQ
jgi:hypothetical protein